MWNIWACLRQARRPWREGRESEFDVHSRWLTVDQMSTAPSSLLPPFALQDFDAPSISFWPSGNHHQTWALIWQNNRTTSWISMDFPCLIARGSSIRMHMPGKSARIPAAWMLDTVPLPVIYHLVMTNSLPWKDPPFLIAKPSISMVIFHGYVSHNQMVHISSILDIHDLHV